MAIALSTAACAISKSPAARPFLSSFELVVTWRSRASPWLSRDDASRTGRRPSEEEIPVRIPRLRRARGAVGDRDRGVSR
jgi:hypothetical protein